MARSGYGRRAAGGGPRGRCGGFGAEVAPFEVAIGVIRMRAKRANYCVAKNATLRAARSGPSSGKKRPPQDDSVVRAGECER